MRISRPLIAACLIAALLVAPAAAAAQFERLYQEYKRSAGLIDGCAHSADELSAALGEIPADIRAYDPEFAEALNRALDQQITGCGRDRPKQAQEEGGGTVVAGDGSPGPATPRPLRLADLGEEPGFPLAVVGAIAVAAALVGVGGGIALARHYGWAPRPRSPGSPRRGRGLGERLSDSFWVLRNRLGR
jgi:hypothetical protein